MRVFVLGASHVGKTPFARRVAEALGMRREGASAWVRERFPEALPDDASDAERARRVEAMTRFATEELRRDPAVSLAHLRARLLPDEPCVVEGMRNPFDFVSTFDPRTDHAVHLERSAGGPPPTAFERGLEVIDAYLTWLVGAGLLEPHRVHRFRYAEYGAPGDPRPDTLEAAIVSFLADVGPLAAADATAPGARGPMGRVHAAIPPIVTHVRAEHLFGMDPARVGELRPCTAFTVSSYPGCAPTFQVLLGDGAVFSYLPATALIDPARRSAPELALEDLVYHDCRSLDVCVHRFDALAGRVLCFFKRLDLWLGGTYLFTVDWYGGNDLLHAIALDNGQYALLPNHKIKFGDHEPGFEPYRKSRREWMTGRS